MSAHLIVVAAGSGSRFGGDIPKQFLRVRDRTILAHTLDHLMRTVLSDCAKKILVLPKNWAVCVDDEYADSLCQHDLMDDDLRQLINVHGFEMVLGADTRAQSVARGFLALNADDDDLVVVHDGARPIITKDDVAALMAQAHGHPVGVLLGARVADTVKYLGKKLTTIAREQLVLAKTPQVYRARVMRQIAPLECSDEAAACERLGLDVGVVWGAPTNVKLTHPDDLVLIDALLSLSCDTLR